MSSLVFFQNAHLITIELAIDKILVSSDTQLDSNTITNTIIKFQIVDNDWVMLSSQCKDNILYNGPNTQGKNFYEGKSVLFAISESDFRHKISNTAIEIHVFRELSDYTTMKPCYNVGSVRIPINSLFNDIIQEVIKQKPLDCSGGKNVISRSLKKTFTVKDQNTNGSSTFMSIYTRLNYFGKSIITEIERLSNSTYRVSEGTCEGQSYQCHEVNHRESETGFWGVENDQLSVNSRNLICIHDTNIRSDDKGNTQVVDTHKQNTMNYTIEDGEMSNGTIMNSTEMQKRANHVNKKKTIKKGKVGKIKQKK